MKNLKKLVLLMMGTLLIACGVACSNSNEPDAGNTEIKKINSSILDGKIANFLGAEGFGVVEKKEQKSGVVYAASATTSTQQKNEFAKLTDDGVYDVHFYDDQNLSSYKELNNAYPTHHHDGEECLKLDCEQISDEIKADEQNGKTKSILSLEARLNKIYSCGDFTFINVTSAIEGEITVLSEYSRVLDHNFQEINGFPTKVNAEDNFDYDSGSYGFSWISLNQDGKSHIIPIKAKSDEKNYHKINYWSTEFCQSFIIDNSTGLTYSLERFPYIYSVVGGIVKVYDENEIGKFAYYKPKITANTLGFDKIALPTETEITEVIKGSKVYIDIYGNMLFDSSLPNTNTTFDDRCEKKVGQNLIFTRKDERILKNNNPDFRLQLEAYKMSKRYHLGNDGRIYRVNFIGDLNNLSVNVLDENGNWQKISSTLSVEFDNSIIAQRVGVNAINWDFFVITSIKDGYAYYSTAANFDGHRIWPKANVSHRNSFTGVYRMPVNGLTENNTYIEDLITEFNNLGLNDNNPYSIVLVGKTQMLYLLNNTLVLTDVSTGKKATFTPTQQVSGMVAGPKNFLNVIGVGYLDVSKNIDLNTFGASSFVNVPNTERQFEEYYKLLMDKTKN